MAKVIFASGIFVMIGIYSLSLQIADEASFRVAKGQALHNQAVQIALAGLEFARTEAGKFQYPATLPSGTVDLLGGTTTYATNRLSATRLRVTSTGTFSDHQIVYVSVLNWQDPRWNVTSTYLQASADEYKRLN
jgi:hypothetical protein